MNLKELFKAEDFLLGLSPVDKWDAIRALMDHLAEAGRIPADLASELHEQVLARERSMSTGMEHGIAIPHAAVEGLDDVVACIGVVPDGLEFESIDARPTQVVVLLLIPRSQKLLHIRTLADIARVLGKESVRQELVSAEGPSEAWQVLAQGEAAQSI